MSIADIVCSRKWPSRGASLNKDSAKNKYYPSFPMVFTATKHQLSIPSADLFHTDLNDPTKRIPVSTTPVELTCISLKISPEPAPNGGYDFEYAKNLMAAKFYEYGDYLVSSPVLARKAIAPPQSRSTPAEAGASQPTSHSPFSDLYVTHVISVSPMAGKYAMLMRSFWSDGSLGGYWCCE
jgi:hypothetical protein